MDWKEFVSQYRWRITGVIGGVVVAILIFTLGFWRTLLLGAIVSLCYVLGRYADMGGKDGFIEALAAILSKK